MSNLKVFTCECNARPQGALGIYSDRYRVQVHANTEDEAIYIGLASCRGAGLEPQHMTAVEEIRWSP